MIDREKVIKAFRTRIISDSEEFDTVEIPIDEAVQILDLLKEQETMKQKMWNALYAEEDELEKKFVGSEDHNAWFSVYRPWLQRGFGIAIKVIAEQEGR